MPHIFNLEHDIVLALDAGKGFVPPRAARKLREDLERLPSIWVKDEDVSVWGWDAAVVAELLRMGVAREQMPSDEQLREIRKLSNRGLAVEMLSKLRAVEGTTGLSAVCYTHEDVIRFAKEHGATILKAPWSSSGRGIKQFIVHSSSSEALRRAELGTQFIVSSSQFIDSTIAKQGSIIAEKKCDKVMDFALEYEASKEGEILYRGLSLFDTVNGAYKGNLLLAEEEKKEQLGGYIARETVMEASAIIKVEMQKKLRGVYAGPFGVDMMVCQTADGYSLNPCIEINLRRTMGHVALALTEQGYRGTMSVLYNKGKDKYELKINQNSIL